MAFVGLGLVRACRLDEGRAALYARTFFVTDVCSFEHILEKTASLRESANMQARQTALHRSSGARFGLTTSIWA